MIDVTQQVPEDFGYAGTMFTDIDISGPANLSSAAVDKIINDVYQSVIDNSRAGNLSLSSNWVPIDDVTPITLLGPPSVASLIKLTDLRDNYAWVIYPDL